MLKLLKGTQNRRDGYVSFSKMKLMLKSCWVRLIYDFQVIVQSRDPFWVIEYHLKRYIPSPFLFIPLSVSLFPTNTTETNQIMFTICYNYWRLTNSLECSAHPNGVQSKNHKSGSVQFGIFISPLKHVNAKCFQNYTSPLFPTDRMRCGTVVFVH